MSKNIILPKKKVVPQTDNIEDLIIKKMESQATVVETKEDMDNPQRINFMMPRYLYDMMKEKLKRKGDKMSNYLIGMVRKDLGDD
jgi:hypothetical protein